MGVTVDLGECPRCRGPAYMDYNDETSEQVLICRVCGYAVEDKIVNGQPYHHEHRGVGVAYIKFKDGSGGPTGQVMNLGEGGDEPVNWEEIFSWLREVMDDPDVDPNRCYLTRYDEEEKKVIYLIGSPDTINLSDFLKPYRITFKPSLDR